jgi:hypothetical protein
MKQRKPAGGEAQQTTPIATIAETAGLDAQLAELIETVFACERTWTLDDRVDAAIKYGR